MSLSRWIGTAIGAWGWVLILMLLTDLNSSTVFRSAFIGMTIGGTMAFFVEDK